MSMFFCHGCGKSIHITALSCPQCGALQAPAQKNFVTKTRGISTSGPPWMGIVSMVLAMLSLLAALEDGSFEDKEVLLGMVIFSGIGVITGVIGTAKEELPKGLSIAGLVISIIMLLVSLGELV